MLLLLPLSTSKRLFLEGTHITGYPLLLFLEDSAAIQVLAVDIHAHAVDTPWACFTLGWWVHGFCR
jgi:hypothetical protein